MIKKIRWAFLLMLLCALAVLYYVNFVDVNSFKALRVAHAGGGIKGNAYTNSYDALDLNINKGFKYFELDFSFTKDNRLVCLHDWTHSFKRSFGFSTDEKVSLEEFKQLVSTKSKFEKCTVDGLATWMEENPSAYIVTDVKEENYKALQIIADAIPNSSTRVIPQVYDPSNFLKIKKLGYEQVIWTLYRYRGETKSVLAWVSKFNGSFAVTMSKRRAATLLPKYLQEQGVPSYVHTVNSKDEKDKFLNNFNVSEIYTDFLVN